MVIVIVAANNDWYESVFYIDCAYTSHDVMDYRVKVASIYKCQLFLLAVSVSSVVVCGDLASSIIIIGAPWCAASGVSLPLEMIGRSLIFPRFFNYSPFALIWRGLEADTALVYTISSMYYLVLRNDGNVHDCDELVVWTLVSDTKFGLGLPVQCCCRCYYASISPRVLCCWVRRLWWDHSNNPHCDGWALHCPKY